MLFAASKWAALPRAVACLIGVLVSAATAQTPAPAAPVTANTSAARQSNPATNQPSQSTPPDQEPSLQEPTANDQAGMFVFKKEVEEVILHATVFDEQRHPVPNLDQNDFTVFDHGQAQTITSFRRQDVPVALGIVIDNSGSMRDKRQEVNEAVLNLIRASNPQDEIFVVNFSQNYYLDQDFTSDEKLLQTALHQASSAGSTALYDAIVASAVHLINNTRLDKKVLLVITDGQDNMSQETLQEALRRLQQKNGPTLYAVGLTGSGLHKEGREALQELAEDTGGVAYFPASLEQVEDITRSVAHDIRSQYMIAYRPHNQNSKPDAQSLQVEAQAPGYGKLTVLTRTGYRHSGQTTP
jgi:Ca-activated chloride channel homolog